MDNPIICTSINKVGFRMAGGIEPYEKYLKENFGQYFKVHIIRSTPFFLQSGYLNLAKAYTGEYNKPDLTASLMKGDLGVVIDYLKNINFSLVIYPTTPCFAFGVVPSLQKRPVNSAA